jgi:hypothetical protein
MRFGCGLIGRDIRRGPREGVPRRVRDAKGGSQRRRRHRDHTSEAATIDADFGHARVVSIGRRRGVACVANDVEGIDDGVCRRSRSHKARNQCGKDNSHRGGECYDAPSRYALNEVRPQALPPPHRIVPARVEGVHNTGPAQNNLLEPVLLGSQVGRIRPPVKPRAVPAGAQTRSRLESLPSKRPPGPMRSHLRAPRLVARVTRTEGTVSSA